MSFSEHIDQLLTISVRGSRPGKTVQMTEAEVRGLCLKSRELFLQQPILLELEAPLKICGELKLSEVRFIRVTQYYDLFVDIEHMWKWRENGLIRC